MVVEEAQGTPEAQTGSLSKLFTVPGFLMASPSCRSLQQAESPTIWFSRCVAVLHLLAWRLSSAPSPWG